MRSQSALISLLVATLAHLSARAEVTSGFALPLSVSLGAGSLKDPSLSLSSRTMSAASLEVLPSYRVGNWAFGPHVDYRLQGQITSLDSAGGSNLKGRALLFGIGFRTQVTERFFVQQSVDFAGQYDLGRDTGDAKVGKFTEPFGVRVKAGFAFLKKIPDLSLVLDAQYLTFQKVEFAHSGKDSNAREMIASVGLTYYFGSRRAPPPEVHVTPPVAPATEPAVVTPSPITPSPVPVPEVPAPAPPAAPAKSEAPLPPLDLKSGPFKVGSRYLGTAYKAKIAAAAVILRDSPNVLVKIEGYVDAAEASYADLGQQRADAVKAEFVGAGLDAARIVTEAVPSRQPASPNQTEDEREANRRVEIILKTEGSK